MSSININSNTELYCIFGNPVRHSLSPVMFNTAFSTTGQNAIYLTFQPSSIEQAVDAMRSLQISGAGVTIPFKREVIKYIDEIDSLASDIGSVNTLMNIDGKITGYNTDGYGALISLKNHIKSLNGSRILLIGNGGSARAIAFTLLTEDVNIAIAGRNIERVTDLVDELKRINGDIKSLLIKDISREFIDNIDIIINTTPVGMTPNIEQTPIDPELILSKHVVFDIVYSPNITRLLYAAQKNGCKTIYGIEMLLNQGVKQFEIWKGEEAPVDVMRSALEENIIK